MAVVSVDWWEWKACLWAGRRVDKKDASMADWTDVTVSRKVVLKALSLVVAWVVDWDALMVDP